jgi:hypothetical protein
MIMKNFDSKFAKQLALAVITFGILGAGAFVTNLRAQDTGSFEVHIPFNFVVKNRTLEAGTYSVGRFNAANPDTIILKAESGKKSLVLLTQRHDGDNPIKISRLTFNRHGDVYFLDSIRAAGESFESRVPAIRSNTKPDGSVHLAQVESIN